MSDYFPPPICTSKSAAANMYADLRGTDLTRYPGLLFEQCASYVNTLRARRATTSSCMAKIDRAISLQVSSTTFIVHRLSVTIRVDITCSRPSLPV